MKKFTLFLMTLLFAMMVNAQSAETKKHEVQSGETLYSIARMYKVSVADLLKMNPNLNPDYIMAGQKINVPSTTGGNVQQGEVSVPATLVQPSSALLNAQQGQQTSSRPKYKTIHEVQKKETVYSISRQYGITEDQLRAANPSIKKDKVKKGSLLNIPYTAEEDRQYNEELRRREEEARKPKIKKYETIKCAIILPFSLSSEEVTAEKQKMTNLYQGFLMAIDSLKKQGCSVDIYAYDEVKTPMSSLLQKAEMKNMQLIVGPMRQYNITTVAKFAHERGITHVIPQSNEQSLVNEHSTMFQVNVPYTMLYPQVYSRFIEMHKKDNVIFVGMNDTNDNVSYIIDFKMALDQNAVPYKRVGIADFNTIKDLLRTDVRNVIIPSSGSSLAFETLCKNLTGLNLSSEYDVQLFGYPEWQTFPSKHDKYMLKYMAQFFTSFYSNNESVRLQQFKSRFRSWFQNEQYSSFPRYGELGYDIGAYFVGGLHRFGSAFYENLPNNTYHSLEFPFHFEKKNDWSGYQNKSLLFVTYRPDGTVIVR